MANKPKLYNIWLRFKDSGWWLEEEGYDNIPDALGGLHEYLTDEMATDVVGGCVVEAGQKP